MRGQTRVLSGTMSSLKEDAGAIVLTIFGAMLVKVVVTGTYLRYLRPDLEYLLLGTGVVISLLGLVGLVRRQVTNMRDAQGDHHPGGPDLEHDHDHDKFPLSAILMVLLVGLLVVVPPPAVGSYSAGRQLSNVTDETDKELGSLEGPEPVSISVRAFAARAVWGDQAELRDKQVALEGFVTPGTDGTWYVSRVSINCCAADGYAFRVEVNSDTEVPGADTWVRVEGHLSDAELTADPKSIPVLVATSVVSIPTPEEPYEDAGS